MVDDVAVVPVALVKYVMEDSKKLVEHNQRQENKIQELQFQLDLKDKQIETLEVMCENYGNQDDDMSDTASSVSYDRRSSAASSSMLRSSSSKLSQPRRPSLRKLSMAPKSKSSRRASAFSGLEGSRSSSLTDAVDMTAKLREEVNTTQNSEEYRRILMATRQISNQKTLDEAIDCILSSACRLLNCSAASLYLVDQRRRKVGVISVEKNRASVPMSVQNVQVDLRMGESIVSRVVETKEQMRIDNVDLCNFYDPVMDNRSQIAIFGMACLPIFGQEQKILGVLQALNKCRKIRTSDKHEEEDAPRFSDQDMVTMAHIGEAASSALNIVNLHSDAKLAHKRIRGLLNLLQDLSEEDSSNTVIERILAVSSRDILETERLSFFTLSADGTTLFLNCSLDTSGIKIPISHGLVGYAARNCEDLMVADAYADARFDKSVDKKTGFTTRSVMCMPVRRYGTNEVLGVIQAINKINGGCFEPEDLDLLKYVARSAGITMHRANLYRTILQNSNYTEARMRLTTVVNKNVGIDVVMHEVMDAARMFIQVQATTLYLVDQTKQELWVTGIQGVSTLRIPIGRGLAGTAAAQGTTMNIVDAYDDPTFDRSFDKKTGFRTKSVLCIPIFDKTKNGDSNRLVAVFQAINRMEGTDVIPFQHHDIKILESFCAEVAITLRYLSFEISCLKIFADSENNSGSTETAQASLLSVFTSQNMATMLSTMQNVSRATEAETSAPRITFSKIVYPDTASFEALLTWEADILSLTHREIFMFIQQAFRKLNFFQTFNITITVLQSFSETVRLKYRGNPFHNFHHGFHCFQAFYLMLQGKAFVDVFNELELLGGLVAALCHDVDHPGHDNSFEVKNQSALSILHNDDAVLERHHARTTFLILQNKSCNIFHSLSTEEFSSMRHLVIGAILATDTQSHFAQLKRLDVIAKDGLNHTMQVERVATIHAAIHGADFAAHSQPLHLAKKWNALLIEEFSNQALKESKLGLPNSIFMCNLEDPLTSAKLMLSYTTYVLFPYWACLRKILPEVDVCYENLRISIEHYQGQVDEYTDVTKQ